MTVHGAKGLEAPVVILADATADPARLGRTPLTVDIEVDDAGVAPLLRPKKDERCPPFEETIADEEQRDLEEHLRLLYVALTRAADRLIVSGVMPKARRTVGTRGRRIAGMSLSSRRWGRSARRRRRACRASPRFAAAVSKRGARQSIELPGVTVPDWARRAAPPEARPPRPLAPSAIAVDDESAPPPSEAMRAAALRGTWIHQLLERLPAVEATPARPRRDRWLERSAGVAHSGGSRGDRRASLRHPLRSAFRRPVRPRIARRGAACSDAARRPRDRRHGRSAARRRRPDLGHRLQDGQGAGKRCGRSRHAHRAQMQAYVEALRVIFPGRRVSASLLYTAGPKLIELMP